MKLQIIKSKFFTIYLYDTSRKVQTYKRRYVTLLKKNALVLDRWISSKASKNKIQIEFSITLCGEKRIKSLNSKYRNKNKITDVLSFPLEDNVMKIIKSGNFQFPLLELGDIFVCREVATRQSSEFQLKIEEELIYLGIHGLLHLFGFDHETNAKDEIKMQKEEQDIAQRILGMR